MFNALGAQTDDGFISGAHPSILEGFFGGLLVVQIAQNNTWAANNQLTGCIIGSDLFAVWGNDARLNTRNKCSRRTEGNICGMS